jgi:hypothetical protein
MLFIYLPALIFEAFCEMLLEPMRTVEPKTCGNRELSARLSSPQTERAFAVIASSSARASSVR